MLHAGGDCGSRLQECELMGGASNPATEAPAPSTVSRTVAPAVLQQLAPSVRYVDPAQSDVIMESGTKSPTVSPRSPPCRLCWQCGLLAARPIA